MISFLLIAVVTYILGAIFQVHILFKLAYFFLALHIILKFYYYNVEKNLDFSHQLIDDHIFLNEKIEARIRVENKGRLPFIWLKVMEPLPRRLVPAEEKKIFYLGPGEIMEWEFSLRGRRRGLYYIGPLECELGDIFAYNIYRACREKLPVFIYPKLLTLEELGLPSRLPFGDIKWPQPIYKDPYQLIGIRDYQPSDSLNKIHWKATARTGKLQARENQSTVSLETALVLNLSQPDYGLKGLDRRIELGITAAASLAFYLTRAGQPFSFISNGECPSVLMTGHENAQSPTTVDEQSRDTMDHDAGAVGDNTRDNRPVNSTADYMDYIIHPVGSGELHLQKVLETLACLEKTEKENFLELLTGSLNLSWGGTVVVLTDKDTDKLIAAVNNLISRGYSVKILMLGDRVEHKEYLNRPFTASLSIHHLRKEEDILELTGV